MMESMVEYQSNPAQLNSSEMGIMPPGGSGIDEGSEDEEDEEELVVLDCEHPLMERFQEALQKQLQDQLNEVSKEIEDLKATEKAEAKKRQELGVEVYIMEGVLSKLQVTLEANTDANVSAEAQNSEASDHLKVLRSQYQERYSQVNKQYLLVSDLQTKVERLDLKLHYLQKTDSSLSSDVKSIINASHKVQKERTQAEEHKHHQDLYVDRLTKQVGKLSSQISLYEGQIFTINKDTNVTKEALSEVQLELDSVIVESKHLLHQYNQSVQILKRRDEVHTGLQDELRQARDHATSLDSVIDGYRRSIILEEEQHEHLTLRLKQVLEKISASNKLLKQFQEKTEILQVHFRTYTQAVQETEKIHRTLLQDCEAHQFQVEVLKKHMEKESEVYDGLEKELINKLQEQVMHSNAASNSARLSEKVAEHRREKVTELVKLENDITTLALSCQGVKANIDSMLELQTELVEKINQQNHLLSACEAETDKNGKLTQRKNATITSLTEKINSIMHSTGTGDMSPLEIDLSNLTKAIKEVDAEIEDLQQQLSWQQGTLLKLIHDKQILLSSTHTLRTQLSILEQSKYKRERELEQEQHEVADLDKDVKALRTDILKLNTLLSQNCDVKQAMQQRNTIMEMELRQKIKEEEQNVVQTEIKLENLEKEKERLVHCILEAEGQIMLWKKKTLLLEETRCAMSLDTEELRAMKADIRRMEVDYTQLMKQQKQLLKDMDAEGILIGQIMAGSHSKLKQSPHTDNYNRLQSLRRTLRETRKQAEECDGVIDQMKRKRSSMYSELNDKQADLTELLKRRVTVSHNITQLQNTKERNFLRLLKLQTRAKRMEKFMKRPGSRMAPDVLESTSQMLETKLQTVESIVKRLIEENPQHGSALRRVNIALDEHFHAISVAGNKK